MDTAPSVEDTTGELPILSSFHPDPIPTWVTLLRWVLICAALYMFLVSVGLMGDSFKLLGKGFSQALINTTRDPFVGLFVGILATSIIQSSSTTTSMIVAFVGSGTLTVENAIPMVMGANIGTTVTSAIVAMGHITRREDFKRAYSAATVHDMFNLISVCIFLPLELATGFIARTSIAMANWLAGTGGLEFNSPLKIITAPTCSAFGGLIQRTTGWFGLSNTVTAVVSMIISILLLAVSLIALSKLLKLLVATRLEGVFNRSIGKNGYLGILVGIIFTILVQSSSVTTSLMVPMAAAGIMSISQVFPVALGANLGTTVTALLAAMATGSNAGLTIALAHFVFNLCGILTFYPIPLMRKIPLSAARGLANLAGRKRYTAPLFVVVVYFVIPGLMMLFF